MTLAVGQTYEREGRARKEGEGKGKTVQWERVKEGLKGEEREEERTVEVKSKKNRE